MTQKLKHIEGEIPLYETRLPTHPSLMWGRYGPGESTAIVYAWHVLNCMPAFQLDVEPPKKGEFGFRED